MREYTPGELSRLLGIPLVGPDTARISGAAALTEARGHELAFVGAAKLFGTAQNSSAGCLIALEAYAPAPGQAVLRSAQPRSHFAAALATLYPERAVSPGIHTTAIVAQDAAVDPTAEIGPYVTIGEGTSVGRGASIGAGSVIGANVRVGEAALLHPRVTIYDRVSIGARAIIHSGAVIGADGFGFEMSGGRYRKVPQVGSVEIGDDSEIGANTCVDRAALGVTVIGEGTKLDNGVHIAHNCQIGKHVVIAAQTGLAGGVTIGDYAIIGGQVGMGDKARVEARAIIGSGAGILTSKIVRAGEPVWGTPARPLRQYLRQLATLSRLAARGASRERPSGD
ncbi:MAG: UDP-3-O-[3-hydroxymyristoyl] glucosamine N-acyltransferase [Bryobacterales bacterium]|nr:UDP-3-O-[3-hydroxymyristoyl] glucosamine N-acyltransferase [Bryobacterales bacterium]